MWSPVKTGVGSISEYGFGWFLDGIPGHRRVWHAGAWQGFSARYERFPDDKLSIIVMTNLGYPDAMTGPFIAGIRKLYLP
jgi:CubicO group peptidase (beta-lactamase class C family)